MDVLPQSLNRLIEELSKLPGIGPKSAQRLAFHLLKASDARTRNLGESIQEVRSGVLRCERCHCLTSQDPCAICEAPQRDQSMLCIVETTLDLIALEKTGEYRGLYHVLQGKLAPLDGVGPEDLRIAELLTRLTEEDCPTREVILALNPDLEGDTTALFIQLNLASLSALQVTRIAR